MFKGFFVHQENIKKEIENFLGRSQKALHKSGLHKQVRGTAVDICRQECQSHLGNLSLLALNLQLYFISFCIYTFQHNPSGGFALPDIYFIRPGWGLAHGDPDLGNCVATSGMGWRVLPKDPHSGKTNPAFPYANLANSQWSHIVCKLKWLLENHLHCSNVWFYHSECDPEPVSGSWTCFLQWSSAFSAAFNTNSDWFLGHSQVCHRDLKCCFRNGEVGDLFRIWHWKYAKCLCSFY